MQILAADLRFAIRFFRRNPGFTLVAILALALGIGVNTALFSVVDAVLLRPLPYGNPDRLVVVWENSKLEGVARSSPSPANFLDWKAQNHVFEDMACAHGHSANLTGDGPPEGVIGRVITANMFPVLGVTPAIGRGFTEEDTRSAEPIVILSDGLWRRRFAADPNVVGRQIEMDGQQTTVIGVTRPGFFYPTSRVEYWLPYRMTPGEAARRTSHYLNVAARLKPGVTLEKAKADMNTIARGLARQYPEADYGVSTAVVPALEQVAGTAGSALWILLAGAGFVLLIACANVANLLLAKAVGRRREIAVRQALGAGRGRLIRQMITESVLLSSLGGALGIALAAFSLRLAGRLVPPAMTASATLSLDVRVMLFAFGLSLATGLLFGAGPALWSGRGDLHDVLKQGGRGGTGGRGLLRDALVVGEVALAIMLLVGAGLMIRTLQSLYALNLGFRSGGLLTMNTRLPVLKYAKPEKRVQFYDAVIEKVRHLPGVQSAAYASDIPFKTQGNTITIALEGVTFGPEHASDALLRVSTPGYLETLGVRVLEGRLYSAYDHANATPVIVINESFKKQYYANQSPLGRRIQISDHSGVWREVIGVVAEVRERGFEPALQSGVYLPVAQTPKSWAIPEDLVVRTATPPLSLAGAVREAVWSVDRDQPITDVRTMDDLIDSDVADRRRQMALLGGFAVLALVLASLGIYGVLAHAVSQRTREIGVRMALGARASDVVRMVAVGVMKLVLLGLALGTAAALAFSQVIAKILYGVEASDPATYASVAALLLLVAMLACAIPARRAASVDPIVALRDE
ncbi:MAG: ABC transporter permease [Bryobacteraceae bacterium]